AALVTLIASALFLQESVIAEDAEPIVLTSNQPAKRWEDALISGNGRQGVMVHGNPLEETIVLNHEKLWVPAQPVKPDVPNMVEAMARARELAKQEKWSPAASTVFNEFGNGNAKMFPKEALIRPGPRFGLNYVHPALHLKFSIPKLGEITDYRRTLTLDTGEINVRWRDDRGDWQRSCFVSRPDNVIVTRLKRPTGAPLNLDVMFAARKGWDEKDIEAPTIEHRDDEMYLQTQYKHLHGLAEAEGYQVLARVITTGGTTSAGKDRIRIKDADEVLILARVEFLPVASQANRDKLRAELDASSTDYDELLASHAKVHGEMFRRVSYRIGGPNNKKHYGVGRTTEEIIAEAAQSGPTPAFLELIYAVGRYCLISSSGELPPTLMGLWGDTWKPMWWGHYTNDSNLNLAISYGSVGNLPEAMDSYFGWIETLYPDWERNASQLYGARGYMGAIAHGWRHGLAIAGWQGWTGAAGWLGAYFWQHYLFTGDEEFLANRVVPLLENVALFYEDFLDGMEG
ncbi:MAG: glycoside hydrolase N-terminal domain-containing protein, partial [Lacipirellulaceae bacterium]